MSEEKLNTNENKVLSVCQNCKTYKRPKCKLTNEFVTRKNEACDSFEFNKNKKVQVSKKVEVKKTDEEIKNDILGINTTKVPDRPKMDRSKTQRRR